MKHFLSGAMAAGWFCLAMAVFAQSMSVSPEPATPGDGIRQGECLQPAVDQRIVGSPREEFVESCLMAFQSVGGIFGEERRAAEQDAKLGPMLSEEYTSARRIFTEDLAQR